MTKLLSWTKAGIAHIDADIKAHEATIARIASERELLMVGANSLSEGRQLDTAQLIEDERIAAAHLYTKLSVRKTLQEAPAPSSNELVMVGTQVTYQREGRDDVEIYIIGGPGESHDATLPKTISCAGPIGKALLSKRAGDDVSVTMPNGVVDEITILAIEIPSGNVVSIPRAA